MLLWGYSSEVIEFKQVHNYLQGLNLFIFLEGGGGYPVFSGQLSVISKSPRLWSLFMH